MREICYTRSARRLILEPGITPENLTISTVEAKARRHCRHLCRQAVAGRLMHNDPCPGMGPCTDWRNFLPATPEAQLEAVSMRGGRPVAAWDFDVVAGPMSVGRIEFSPTYGEPCVEAPRPPALPEHPAVEAMLALRNASAIDQQRRAAALVLRTVGISDEVFEATALHRDEKYGGEGYHESWAGSVASDVREIFEAVLAEILA
jgi:hypothetical protein